MPRPLVFGNGRLLVQLDGKGRIRDFFWPEVGIRNHVGGHYHHLGIWVDGRFSWTEWDEWTVSQDYLPGTMIGITSFQSGALGLVLDAQDEVVEDAFVRTLTLTNLRAEPRRIEVFFSQDFRIAESEIGDTAMYLPALDAMVHFKWNYYFACSARSAGNGLQQKTVGLRGINGLQGTWRDAEDGQLQQKPIEQGAVDSTFSIVVNCPASGSAKAEYRIDCYSSLPLGVLPRGSDSPRTAEIKTIEGLEGLPAEIRSQADRSLAILRTQIDNRGGILAANDSDIMRSNRATYSYVWPRDGALVAAILDRVGEHDLARRYHEFSASLLTSRLPFFLQKYNADGTLGATWHPWTFDGAPVIPFQIDETALTVWSIWRHAKATEDIGWLKGKWTGLIKPMSDFLAAGPSAGYDLWEERRGIHTFSEATIVAALGSASEMAAAIGDDTASSYSAAAEQLKAQLLETATDYLQTGSLTRGWTSASSSSLKPDLNLDASLLLVGRFAGIPADHAVMRTTAERIERELWVHSPIGGIARYAGDYYARVSEKYPGNPWVITTMWLAQEKIRAAVSADDLGRPLELLQWAVDRAETTGVMGEQYHPETGEVLTVSPLTWSHAEFVATCLDWCEKSKHLEKSKA